MPGLRTRIEGAAGRLTFTRPDALNALNHVMSLKLETALDLWRGEREVALVVIDAEGPRAFCAGGDIAAVYRAGVAGDFAPGREFWRDEYRMNLKLATYTKPIVSFMQGFVMGGGVGVGCHVAHRVVGETTQMAMPETGIGLIPDVGGSLLLARAPGAAGLYLGLTGARMSGADAIWAGFADYFLPEAFWPDVIPALEETGDLAALYSSVQTTPESPLAALAPHIDAAFGHDTAPEAYVAETLRRLAQDGSDWARGAEKALARMSPLSMAATVALIRSHAGDASLKGALTREFRMTHRAFEQLDFLEGVRAQIIDKDRAPRWRASEVTERAVAALLAPLDQDLLFTE